MKNINDHLIDEYNISCEYYETKYKYVLTKINILNKNKPLRIFKNKYNKWKNKLDILYKELNDINKQLNKEYEGLEALFK